jgi:hypothetical protein
VTSYLGGLARRSVAPESAVRPRLRGLFEPLPGPEYLRPPGPVEVDDFQVAEGIVAPRGAVARSPAPSRGLPAGPPSGTGREPPAGPSPEPRRTPSRAPGTAEAQPAGNEGPGDEMAGAPPAHVLRDPARLEAAEEVHVRAAGQPPPPRFEVAPTHDRPRRVNTQAARGSGERPGAQVVPPSSGHGRAAAGRHDGELPGGAIAVAEEGGVSMLAEEAVDGGHDGSPELRSASLPERTPARDPWPAQAQRAVPPAPVPPASVPPAPVPAAPVVHVTIGRIDVRATPAQQPSARSRRDRRTAMTLAEYLQSRDSGR